MLEGSNGTRGGGLSPVSADDEPLILVDEQDRPKGHLDKRSCHDGAGRLHRAFSVFLFNAGGELLLQQRAAGKRLWPLYWSNTCCSHPRRGESTPQAAERRLQQELGLSAGLRFAFKFRYQARFQNLGSEHELCWVFLGRCDAEPAPHPAEVADWRWTAPATLDRELAGEAAAGYTPWLRLEWQRLRTEHAGLLEEYAGLKAGN